MNQKFLFDTDILSFFLKNHPIVVGKFKEAITNKSECGISILTDYEILSGLYFKNSEKYLKKYLGLKSELNLYPLTENSVEHSAKSYSILRKKGTAVDDIDLLIAGIAIANKMILITGNEIHFKKIPSLKIENWTK